MAVLRKAKRKIDSKFTFSPSCQVAHEVIRRGMQCIL